MRKCRFFPWCSYIEDHGCTKDSCRHYQPMPDVEALLALEDEMFEDATGLAFISQLEENEELQDLQSTMAKALMDYARRIREALGVADG